MKKNISISLAELKHLLDTNKNVKIIDVRSEAEYLETHIPIAINISIDKIEVINIPKDGIIITTCGKGGGRSEKAAELIRNKTNTAVYFLENGTFGWFENEK
jgi:rhodanese-related sulfurtransferase